MEERTTCSIYKIVCSVNGKVYIGQTWKNIEHRWRAHINDALGNYGNCVKLVRAINKHGKNNFSISIITQVGTQEDADITEQAYIGVFDSLTNGYNIREGGAHGKLAESTKAKMRIAQTGKVIHEETRAKISATLTGRINGPPSPETIEKIASAQRGKKRTPEARAVLSAAHTGVLLSDEHRAQQSKGQKKRWELLPPEIKQKRVDDLTAARVKKWAEMSDEQKRQRGINISLGHAKRKEKGKSL